MNAFREIRSILKSIDSHPLAGRHRLKAYTRFLSWQVGRSIIGKEKKIKFTDRSWLLVKKGMAGATGNIYTGLHEFQEMGFLLHLLRDTDLFLDIGANIGSYTVLASGHIGARSMAFEPIPSTFHTLERNVKVNRVDHLAQCYNFGVGAAGGKLRFTSPHDTVNHVVPDHVVLNTQEMIEVEVVAVDNIIASHSVPVLVKIDVEGFETEVIRGMSKTLECPELKAIIIELNGSGDRYGYDEIKIHDKLLSLGFEPYDYDPFARKLQKLAGKGNLNTIYLRDIPFVRDRIAQAPKIKIFSELF